MKLGSLLKLLPEDIQKDITQRLGNLSRFARIGYEIEYINAAKRIVRFQIKQIDRMTDKVYPLDGMRDFFLQHLRPVSESGWTVQVNPVKYEITGLDYITSTWVREQMAKYNLAQKDLVNALDVDKHVISRVLSEDYGFTRWHKAAFFYYFKYLENKKESWPQD